MSRALLSVQVDDVWMALDATRVVEVLGEQLFIPIPEAPAFAPGVMSWRGRAVATVDIGALSGVAGPMVLSLLDGRRRTVIVRVDSCTFALPVDTVREVQEVGQDRVTLPHATQNRYAAGEVELHGHVMPILDLAAMMEAIGGPASGATFGAS